MKKEEQIPLVLIVNAKLGHSRIEFALILQNRQTRNPQMRKKVHYLIPTVILADRIERQYEKKVI